MPRTRYDVFLSYRRADTALVQPLRDELRRLGYRVFFDTQSIEGGDDWKNRIETAIAGSRALILCWSANAAQSEIVTFEYSCAKALHRPVIPWLLDHTHLPVMLDHINGIRNPDAVQVAAAIRPRLGRTLQTRRTLQAVTATLLTVALAFGIRFALKPPPPPPPWDFQGEVTDPITRLGISGVEVDATPPQGPAAAAQTGEDGRFDLRLPAPQPKYLHLRLGKDGYLGTEADKVPANEEYHTTLLKQP